MQTQFRLVVCLSNRWFGHSLGGANSHMAIRLANSVCPVIGAGEVLYRRWSGAERLLIDCAGRRVEVLA